MIIACKKDPSISPEKKPDITHKSYEDYDFGSMVARSGFYITDTIWNKEDMAKFTIRKSPNQEYVYPLSGDVSNIYLGSAIDGKYFMENNGSLKAYTKFQKKPLYTVTSSAYNLNLPRVRLDVPLDNKAAMDSLVKVYLSGAKPSIYGFARYEYVPFSNYNQLKLFFGDDMDVRSLFNINSSDDMSNVENGLVYYYMKETFNFRLFSELKHFFKQPFNMTEVQNDEAGYINKITYGKIGIMTIDSKLKWREMRTIISKIEDKKVLSSSELAVLNMGKVHTSLIGYSLGDQAAVNKSPATNEEKVISFFSICTPPKNFETTGTFSYGDHGVPIFFELKNLYSGTTFLEGFNFSKTINL
ncbi:hypothetical protein [Arcticibacter svalbardensis]|nr:hypothetical protein [Arcticibacter svalbardensis]